MPTPDPHETSPTTVLPIPCPIQPVAVHTVDPNSWTFDWTPVPDATHYRVQVADTETFESVRHDETTGRPTSIPLGSVLPDGTALAHWRVRAEADDSDPSPWSDPARLVLRPEAEGVEDILRVDASPVPIHPTEDTPVDRRAVPFSWEEVPDASGYQIQVAPTEDFAAPAVDLMLDQTSTVTVCERLSPGASPFYWRIRALFRGSDPGPWSTPPVSFAISSPLEEEEDLATEASAPNVSAAATGPAQDARTSRAMALTVSLFMVLGFAASVLLVAYFS